MKACPPREAIRTPASSPDHPYSEPSDPQRSVRAARRLNLLSDPSFTRAATRGRLSRRAAEMVLGNDGTPGPGRHAEVNDHQGEPREARHGGLRGDALTAVADRASGSRDRRESPAPISRGEQAARSAVRDEVGAAVHGTAAPFIRTPARPGAKTLPTRSQETETDSATTTEAPGRSILSGIGLLFLCIEGALLWVIMAAALALACLV